VVLVEIAVVVGSGACVANMVSVSKPNGLPLQSRSVAPPVQRRNCGSTEPPNSRSAVHSGVWWVSEPPKLPWSSVPTSRPLTCPLAPLGVTKNPVTVHSTGSACVSTNGKRSMNERMVRAESGCKTSVIWLGCVGGAGPTDT
jgi:hypothetical protein